MKGSMLDIPVILILLMTGIITVIVVALVVGSINDAWPMADESKDILEAGVSSIYLFDYGVLLLAVGASLFSIISAYYVRSHPIFFIFSMIMLSIVIMFSAVVTNVLYAFVTATPIVVIANSFPYSVILITNLPLFSLIVGILIAIAMYGKSDDQPGGGI